MNPVLSRKVIAQTPQAIRKSFADIARGDATVLEKPQLPEVHGPADVTTGKFAYQSWHDTTLLQAAIAIQPQNNLIVPSTLVQSQQSGYGLVLHPSSETPVAVRFRVAGGKSGSSVQILKPGHLIRPIGKPGDGPTAFVGFDWGLPFGWLGGGVAQLFVLKSPDAWVAAGADAEIPFHRMTLQVIQPGSAPAHSPKNWPTRFPWTQATQGSNATNQKGTPVLTVFPSRLRLSPRISSLSQSTTVRFVLETSLDFDAQVNDMANPRFVDVTIPAFSQNAAAAGVAATPYPVIELNPGTSGPSLVSLGSDDGGITLIDMSADGTGANGNLTGVFFDVTRYGRL